MRVPYEWLKEIIDISASPEEVSDKLTMIGLEVEGSESIDDDIVFEVNVTPNRPDCLSIIGIARELSAAYRIPLKVPEHGIKYENKVSDFTIDIRSPELCNRYAGIVITGVSIKESPDWVKSRLEKSGIRAINNIVDITNYVLLEFGHPLHAFDADTLSGRKIIVGTPKRVKGKKENITFRTLDGIDRAIPSDSLLIWDAENPVAVAGVMGGADTEVTDKTKNIFLESAYFVPLSIRKTSKQLNLTSESSYRFERGTDIEFLAHALERAALLIRKVAGGTIQIMLDAYPVKYKSVQVRANVEKINNILGTSISQDGMIEILKGLNIPVKKKGKTLMAYPPAYRRDIQRDYDIAEEVARIFGYGDIPTTKPKSPLSSGRQNMKLSNLSRISESMRKAGFTEVINYSFMGITSLDFIDIPPDDRRRKTIALNNPLSKETSLLRTTLIPLLLENLLHNLDRGIEEIRLFEIATVFIDEGDTLPREEMKLSGIFYQDRKPSLWKEVAHEFSLVKGAIESVFDDLKIYSCSYVPSQEKILHIGQAADIFLSDSHIGYLGVLAPEIVHKLDLKKQKPNIVVFELDLETILQNISPTIHFVPIAKYPSVKRDIALIVDESVPAGSIRSMIRTFPSEFIEDVSIFDYYKGAHIPEGKKSLAFNIIYRSKERTLRDEEVSNLHDAIVAHVLKETEGELRK